MKRLRSRLMGIEQGDTVLFSDFENDGEMWTGRGQRERRRRIKFSEPFHTPPNVQTSVSLLGHGCLHGYPCRCCRRNGD